MEFLTKRVIFTVVLMIFHFCSQLDRDQNLIGDRCQGNRDTDNGWSNDGCMITANL